MDTPDKPPALVAARTDQVFVVMGAYQESAVIGEVVRELRRHYRHVVVVDDGSSDATAIRAGEAGALVLRHPVNRGQGAALQTGISYSLSQGAGYVVTFDADGQHCVEDVASLLEPLMRGEAEIVLGSRFLGTTENMPWAKRLLLKAGVLFTRGMSGGSVTDTHNGLRGFTRRAASALTITEDRMAHASELIDRVVRSGLPYLEVPVTIRYTDYSRAKGQSITGSFRIVLDYLSRKLLGPV